MYMAMDLADAMISLFDPHEEDAAVQ